MRIGNIHDNKEMGAILKLKCRQKSIENLSIAYYTESLERDSEKSVAVVPCPTSIPRTLQDLFSLWDEA